MESISLTLLAIVFLLFSDRADNSFGRVVLQIGAMVLTVASIMQLLASTT